MEISVHKAKNLAQAVFDEMASVATQSSYNTLFDQRYFDGGNWQSTWENVLHAAQADPECDIVLACDGDVLAGYMIFYTEGNPEKLAEALAEYAHLGKVVYSDLLMVAPAYQKAGISGKVRDVALKVCADSGADVVFAYVRALPVPNLPSLAALKKYHAVITPTTLKLKRFHEALGAEVDDVCLEALYPVDAARRLHVNEQGQINWCHA